MKLKWNWDCSGMSRITPVTLRSLLSLSTTSVRPMMSVLLKSRRAALSSITMERGLLRAVLGSPAIMQCEYLKDRRVGKSEVMFEDVVVALPHQQITRVAEPDHLPDLRIGSDERGAK